MTIHAPNGFYRRFAICVVGFAVTLGEGVSSDAVMLRLGLHASVVDTIVITDVYRETRREMVVSRLPVF